jgi:hypothetical protein
MSDFEYASVVVSIVLALGIADVLRFLADTFRESNSRRLYWVHLLWIFVLLQLHVEFWWRMWSFRELVTVGPSLGLILLGPAILFVTTRTMLPAGVTDSDLQALFYRRKGLFFVMFALLNTWALMFSPWSTGIAPDESTTAVLSVFAIVMILFITCVFSNNQLLHKCVVSLVVVFEVLDIFAVV